MIAGVVTTKDVLLHSATIVQDFGLRTWLNCCKAVLTNRRTTFLELVWRGWRRSVLRFKRGPPRRSCSASRASRGAGGGGAARRPPVPKARGFGGGGRPAPSR